MHIMIIKSQNLKDQDICHVIASKNLKVWDIVSQIFSFQIQNITAMIGFTHIVLAMPLYGSWYL